MFIKILKKYVINVLIAIDQLINAILLGDPDETLSSRAGKAGGFWAKLIDTLLFWDKNHTKDAIEKDEGGRAIK